MKKILLCTLLVCLCGLTGRAQYIEEARKALEAEQYEKAAEYAAKIISKKPKLAEAYMILGDANYNLSKMSAAYSAYRNAYDLDDTNLRAKLHIAIITKTTQAFPEAVNIFHEIIYSHPDYAPAYRELAETYYLWALTDKKEYTEHIAEALVAYKKYMTLTDNSINVRMRHADFLILARDYKELEKEALAMQQMDKVNPRILRYLGYAAYENGNYEAATDALTAFISSVEPERVTGLDYIYLGKAEMQLAVSPDTLVVDTTRLDKCISCIEQSFEKNGPFDDEFSKLGVKLYKTKKYDYAARLFEVIILNPKSSLLDNLYFSNSVLYATATQCDSLRALYQPKVLKADSVFALVINKAPKTQDAYFNRARLNRYLLCASAESNAIKYYEEYIAIVNAKGDSELAKGSVKVKLSEAYTSIGSFYADTDQPKAIENFEKAISVDPANEHAIQSLKFLQKK